MSNGPVDDKLKAEISGLLLYLQRVRTEIAAMGRGRDEEHNFESMGKQLDAIVEATEHATETIMNAMEQNEECVTLLKAGEKDPKKLELLDKISDNGNAVFEACSFQDITGQRVTKIIKSISFVEERVESLLNIWGREALAEVETGVGEETKREQELMLHGPKVDGQESISQAEIDKLFD
ncbi:MAG: protein phosphatase CheZ [Rhodospirillales bacterium]